MTSVPFSAIFWVLKSGFPSFLVGAGVLFGIEWDLWQSAAQWPSFPHLKQPVVEYLCRLGSPLPPVSSHLSSLLGKASSRPSCSGDGDKHARSISAFSARMYRP